MHGLGTTINVVLQYTVAMVQLAYATRAAQVTLASVHIAKTRYYYHPAPTHIQHPCDNTYHEMLYVIVGPTMLYKPWHW